MLHLRSGAAMNLVTKTTIWFVAGLAALIIGVTIALQAVIAPGFQRAEADRAERQTLAAVRVLDSKLESLRRLTIGMATTGPDTPALQRPQDWVDTPRLEVLNVDGGAQIDAQGRVIAQSVLHPALAGMDLAAVIGASPMMATHPLHVRQPGAGKAGFYATPQGVMMVASAAVVDPVTRRPQGITLTFRLLDDARLATFSREAGADIQLIHPANGDAAFAAMQSGRSVITTASSATTHTGYSPLRTPAGAVAAIVAVETPDVVRPLGQQLIETAALTMLLAALLSTVLAGVGLHVTVVRPISKLSRAMTEVRATGDLKTSIESGRKDEIGTLMSEFAHLVREGRRKELELQGALESAERAAAAKAEFLATMSHEIRTPLNGVLGIAHVLKREGRDPGRLAMVDTIISSGELLLGILNDVLDMAKIEAGKLEIVPRPVDPALVLGDLAALWRVTAEGKGLYLVVSAPDGPGDWVSLDPVRLRQILFNLVGNAIKFTDAGGVAVSVSRPRPGWVRFEVADTGLGIDAEEQARLFRPFAQVENGTRRAAGGTGLGLAIARRLAALMGGELGLTSAPGQGSTFWLEAPAAACAPPAPAVADAVDAASIDAIRVLVAEDNATNRLVIGKMLGLSGVAPVFAEDGAQAVEIAETQAFDLILMDVRMPVMDGLEATRRIRTGRGPNARAPIVALTANVTIEDQAGCFAAGMTGFVPKPIQPQTLFDAMSEALSQSRPDAAAA
jgi:signal transduction histidine kinase/ActR/RegA family two-component response regulator